MHEFEDCFGVQFGKVLLYFGIPLVEFVGDFVEEAHDVALEPMIPFLFEMLFGFLVVEDIPEVVP